MSRLWRLAAVAALLGLVSGVAYTPKHEAGRCSIRGSCGSSGFFSPALPCPDNGLAREPEDDVRKQLVDICGPKWNTGAVCCEAEQVYLAYDLVLMHLLIFYSLIRYQKT
jgi:Niemann-Pick C1 protein